jgi:hypothetical protein
MQRRMAFPHLGEGLGAYDGTPERRMRFAGCQTFAGVALIVGVPGTAQQLVNSCSRSCERRRAFASWGGGPAPDDRLATDNPHSASRSITKRTLFFTPVGRRLRKPGRKPAGRHHALRGKGVAMLRGRVITPSITPA